MLKRMGTRMVQQSMRQTLSTVVLVSCWMVYLADNCQINIYQSIYRRHSGAVFPHATSQGNALSPLLVFMSAELDITTVQKGTLSDAYS